MTDHLISFDLFMGWIPCFAYTLVDLSNKMLQMETNKWNIKKIVSLFDLRQCFYVRIDIVAV